MSAYKMRVTGSRDPRAVHEIRDSKTAAVEAEGWAKSAAAMFKERTVLVYRGTIHGDWGPWKAWRWNETRSQVERATVGRSTWDEYEPKGRT